MTMLFSKAVTSLATSALAALFAASAHAQQANGGLTVDPPRFEHVASGPASYFGLRDGLSAVVDTLAGSVAFLDGKGGIVGRAALPESYVVSDIRIEEGRVRLLSADGRSAIDIPREIDGAAPPALSAAPVAPGARRAGAGRLRRSSTELAIGPVRRGEERSQGWLEIKSVSGGAVADAREFGADGEGRRYVAWSEVAATDPEIVIRAFIGRYDAQGAITGVAEAPIADMEYVPDNYASVSAGGDVTVLVPAKTGVEIRSLPLQTLDRAARRGGEGGDLKRALRKSRKAGRVLENRDRISSRTPRRSTRHYRRGRARGAGKGRRSTPSRAQRFSSLRANSSRSSGRSGAKISNMRASQTNAIKRCDAIGVDRYGSPAR